MDMSIVQHEAPFGVLIVLYLFLAGLSQGLFLVAAASLFAGLERFRPLARPAAAMAMATYLPAVLALILDLGKPSRFIHMLLYYNPSSVMSWGSVILIGYGLVLAALILLLWRNHRLARLVGAIGMAPALGLGLYTGLLLAAVRDRPLWSSGLVPVLFVVSGLVAGMALLMALARWTSGVSGLEKGHGLSALHSLKAWLVGAELVMLGLHFLVLFTGTASGQIAVRLFVTGPRQVSFLWVQVALGMLLPLLLLLLGPVRRSGVGSVVAAVLSLAGVFALRYNLVIGGGEIPLTSAVMNRVHTTPFVWGAVAGLSAAALVLVLLLPRLMGRLTSER